MWLISNPSRAATTAAVSFQEISVQLPAESESNEPIENPPTYVKANGRVIASEWPAPQARHPGARQVWAPGRFGWPHCQAPQPGAWRTRVVEALLGAQRGRGASATADGARIEAHA